MEVEVDGSEMSQKPNLLRREIGARTRVLRLGRLLEVAQQEAQASRIDCLVANAHSDPVHARAIAWELALELNEHLQAAAEARGMDLVVKAIVNQTNPQPYETDMSMKVWFLEAGGVIKNDLLIYQKMSRLEGQPGSSHIRLFVASEMEENPL